MDNRPVELRPIIAFRESDLDLVLRYQEGVTIPSSFSTEFRVNRQKLQVSSTSPTISGRDITIKVPKEQVQTLPAKVDLYIKAEDRYLFEGTVNVLMGGGTNVAGVFEVDNYHGIAVFVTDLVAVKEQVQLAKVYADQAKDYYEDILQQLNDIAQGPKGDDGEPGQPGEPGEPGEPGPASEFRVQGTTLQTRVIGNPTWSDILDFNSLTIFSTISSQIDAVSGRVDGIEQQLNNLPEQ